jgi:putative mRNA 3-end processing factor
VNAALLEQTDRGLYCADGVFHIDPWRPVERAIITHAHSDHARSGSRHYLTAAPGVGLVRARVGEGADVEGIEYAEARDMNGVRVSLHPAGHCLGSSQVRLQRDGEVWVVSGDYKTQREPTCEAFEPLRCDTFITECTFGLPVFRWPPHETVMSDLNAWWAENAETGVSSIIFAYALGKAQRVLAGLDPSIGPIFAHGAVRRLVERYREAGVDLPEPRRPEPDAVREANGRCLVLAPPSALTSTWLRRFGELSTGFVSGWMQLRGTRRRRNVDRGFVLSDHVDWDGLHGAIRATGAQHIIVTHGFTDATARFLTENGFETEIFRTRFEGESLEPSAEDDAGDEED